MKISERAFAGIIPRLDARALPDGASQVAENVKLWRGTLQPWRGPGTMIVDGADSPVCLYRAGQNDPANSDTQYWWQFANDASVVRGPIFDDNNETTYFTVDTDASATVNYSLKVIDKTKFASVGNGGDPTSAAWLAEVPTPSSAPTLTVQGIPATKAADPEARVYYYTYVNSAGFEGAPSPASAVVTTWQDSTNSATHYVDVTVTEPTSATAYRCYESGAEIRVYCAASGSAQLVGVIRYNGSAWAVTEGFGSSPTLTDLGSTLKITDKLLSSGRGEVITTDDWLPPPTGADGLKGLKSMPGGLLVGIHKNNVCFCDPYHPHAWPLSHRHALDYQPVAIGIFGNTAVIGTTGYPYIVTGTEPTTMVPQKIERNQSCVSARSMAELGGGVAFASPDGLCVVDGSGLNLVSEKLYSRDEWQALNPASIHAVAWDGKYVMFCDPTNNGSWDFGLIWDFTTGPVSLNLAGGDVRAMFVDMQADKLYYTNNLGQVSRFDYSTTAGTALTYTRRSKIWEHPQPVSYGCAQVHANAYDNGGTQDLNFKVYADGALKHTQVVTSRNPFRLPSGFKAREWEFEIVGNVESFAYDAATVMQELMNG